MRFILSYLLFGWLSTINKKPIVAYVFQQAQDAQSNFWWLSLPLWFLHSNVFTLMFSFHQWQFLTLQYYIYDWCTVGLTFFFSWQEGDSEDEMQRLIDLTDQEGDPDFTYQLLDDMEAISKLHSRLLSSSKQVMHSWS